MTFAELADQLADHLDSEVMDVEGANYVVIPVSADVGADEVLDLRADAVVHGGFIFFAEPPTGEDDWAVGLAPGTSAQEAVLAVGTSGGAEGPTPEKVVAWLDEVAKLGAFTVTLITPDAIGLEFEATPKDLSGLASRVHAICPQVHADIVELLAEGDEDLSPEEFAAELGLPADISTLTPERVLELVFAQDTEVLLRWVQ